MRRASEFNILLEDVSLTHLTFGTEFTKAVEAKQVAQQDAERARFIVEKVCLAGIPVSPSLLTPIGGA